MDNKNKSSKQNVERDIKQLQEHLKASGTLLKGSLQEYRKKIEALKSADLAKSSSQSQLPSSSSSVSINIKLDSENCVKNKKNDNYKKEANFTRKKSTTETSVSTCSLDSSFTDEKLSENTKTTNKVKIFTNQKYSQNKQEIQNDRLAKNNLKEKVERIKSQVARFERNSKDTIRYASTSLKNNERQRSISEKSIATTSNYETSSSNLRHNSISTNISVGNSTETEGNCNKVKKRSRGKRGSKSKTNENEASAPYIPYYAKECETLHINAETLLILDLLLLPLEQHSDYLVNLAKLRKIFVPCPGSTEYVYNPRLKHLNQILQLGNQCRNFNSQELTKLQNLMTKNQEGLNTDQQRKQTRTHLDSEARRNLDRKPKYFEDYVNEIVGEYLSEDLKQQYMLPKGFRAQRTKNYINEPKFENELELYAQKLVKANLGSIVEGEIRVNQKNNDQAFVKNVAGKKDAFLSSLIARKNALNGDVVRIFIRNDDSDKQITKMINENLENNRDISAVEKQLTKHIQNSQKDSLLADSLNSQPSSSKTENNESINDQVADEISFVDAIDETEESNNSGEILFEQENDQIPDKNFKAFVIKIVEHVHDRKCVGNFLSYRKDSEYITFVPRDLKMPNLRIYKPNLPEPFQKGDIKGITDMLYVAEIIDWQNGICIGKILKPIGKCGELESENKAILLQNGLEMEPYEDKYNEMFSDPINITEKDIQEREDLRTECIFTIDPLTAKDLDDALSCKELQNGNYEIGVHISDVTHFLEEKSELDEIVALRSTSVYMVQEVFHMLPKPLCFKCSLLPAEDKFAFSCFWEISQSGDILKTRMSRTIVNSCTQFAYEHAQKIIDNPDKIFLKDEFPQIHNGWTIEDIVNRVKKLFSISEKWRAKRFENGALKINRPKLYFHLNSETGEPAEYFQAILQPANSLIEEFMLMANQSVADFIYKKFPKISFLRNHEPPLPNVIQKVDYKLRQIGLNIDLTSSKSIYKSLSDLIKSSDNPQILEVCLTHLISKPMTRAKYFCSENAKTSDDFWHYALSIPIYTHFTSPIRRYPDILVHRVLAAALGYTEPPKRTPDELHNISNICNNKKFRAKLAGEDSSNLYFMYYIKSKKSVLMKAAVLEFFQRSMEVILIVSGHQIRVTYPNEKSNMKINFVPKTKSAILIKENEHPMELKPFWELDVEVYVEKLKIKARLPGSCKTQHRNEIEDQTIDSSPVVSTVGAENTEFSDKENKFDLENTSDKKDIVTPSPTEKFKEIESIENLVEKTENLSINSTIKIVEAEIFPHEETETADETNVENLT